MYTYKLEINQEIVIVKNILIGQGVAVVVENVLGDLVVIAVTKNDRVDHAVEVKGMCITLYYKLYIYHRIRTLNVDHNFFYFLYRNSSSRRSSPHSRHETKNHNKHSRSKSKEKYTSSHNYFLEKKANNKRQSNYFFSLN